MCLHVCLYTVSAWVSVFVGVRWRRVFAVAALCPCEEDSFGVQFAAQGISLRQHDEEEEEEEEEDTDRRALAVLHEYRVRW